MKGNNDLITIDNSKLVSYDKSKLDFKIIKL